MNANIVKAQTEFKAKDDPQKIKEKYEELIKANEKKAASIYISDSVKKMVSLNKTGLELNAVLHSLVGKEDWAKKHELKKEYTLKINSKSKKPRLMFCSGYWRTGGMERVMSVIFNQLKDDYDIFLLTPYVGWESKIALPEYVTHIKISKKLYRDSFDTTAFSHALILDIDIVIGFMNLFEGQLKLYELCAEAGIRTIASNHESYLYPYYKSELHELVNKRLQAYKSVDAVLWPTNYNAVLYGLASANSYLMPNPNTYEQQEICITETKKIILCVGRFNDHVKRIDRILDTFSIVSKKHKDAKLVLVGKYDLDMTIKSNSATTLAEYIKELNIDKDKIDFTGEVDNIEDYYRNATVLLLASINEGFGMVINEAACFGVPTVYNKIPGLEDLIVDGKNGLMTEQNDIKAMADAVNKILSDEKLRESLSANARRMVANFNAIEIGNKWKYLISTLLGGESNKNIDLNKLIAYEAKSYGVISEELFNELNRHIAINCQEITKNKELVATLRTEIADLNNTKDKLGSELLEVYGSAKWKYATKVGNIKRSISRKKGKH